MGLGTRSGSQRRYPLQELLLRIVTIASRFPRKGERLETATKPTREGRVTAYLPTDSSYNRVELTLGHLSRVVGNSAIGETDYHPKCVFAINK
jgi:hypothetical protein